MWSAADIGENSCLKTGLFSTMGLNACKVPPPLSAHTSPLWPNKPAAGFSRRVASCGSRGRTPLRIAETFFIQLETREAADLAIPRKVRSGLSAPPVLISHR